MATTGNTKTVDELENALALLDHELEGLQLDQPVRIRAIGGFALLKHGIRSEDRAYTVDIDSVTSDYAAEVVRAIEIVAEKASLDKDWLNNYNVMDNDPERVEQLIEAEWLPQPTGHRNIAVSIASIETLTRSKIIAVDDMEHSERLQDLPDLIELLKHQKITDVAGFKKKYPDPFGDYPETRSLIGQHYGEKTKAAGNGVMKEHAGSEFPELDGMTVDPYGFNDGYGDDSDFDHDGGPDYY